MKNGEFLAVHNIWQNKMISWIKTYKTLLKYITIEYKDIFKPISKGHNTGKRYFVKKENVDKFIKMFENHELPDQKN